MGMTRCQPGSPPLEVRALSLDGDTGLGLSLAWRPFRGWCLAPGLNRCIIAATLSWLPILHTGVCHRRLRPKGEPGV